MLTSLNIFRSHPFLTTCDLKKLIVAAGLSPAGLLEKAELVEKAKEARSKLDAAAAAVDEGAERRWVTCPLCKQQILCASEEECTAHFQTCEAFKK